MAITKIFSSTAKTGWKFDAKKGKYFSYKIDVYFGGKRIREKGFLTKTAAENVVAKLKLLEKEKKIRLTECAKIADSARTFRKADRFDYRT